MSSRIEEIAQEVMRVFLERHMLKAAAKHDSDACLDQIECALGHHLNSDANTVDIYRQMMGFTCLQDFNEAIEKRSLATSERYMQEGFYAAIRPQTQDESGDGIADIARSISVITERGILKRAAFLYAYLTAQPDRLTNYFNWASPIEPLRPGSILDNNRKEALDVLKELRLYSEWCTLATKTKPIMAQIIPPDGMNIA